MSQPARRHAWERRTFLLTLRINLAAWLEAFAPYAFGVASAGAVALYALRRLREPASLAWVLLFSGWLAAAVLVAWLCRQRFFSQRDTRIFLEYNLGLDAGLSAAEEGLAPWPEFAASRGPRLLRLRWAGPLGWLSCGGALLAAALWLPIPSAPRSPLAAEKSPALAEAERLIEELKQSDSVEAESLERLATEARQLGLRPLDEQYSHSALEAADQLYEQTLAGTQNLGKAFDEAAEALNKAEAGASQMTEPEAKQLEKSLAAALQGMRSGQLAANEKLKERLEGMNTSKLRQLSPEQLASLKNAMNRAGAQMKGISGARKQTQIAKGDGQPGSMGEGTQGGTGGGGDTAPLAFRQNASPELEGKADGLESADLSRASLGDNRETTDGRHPIDPAKALGPQAAGAIAGKAQGGDAVWVDRLTPAERAALKEFFK